MRIFSSFFMLLSFFCLKVMGQGDTSQVNVLLDTWHRAAAEANFDTYFSLMDTESVFIGTDATERWSKAEFIAYAKPHFDKGRAWNMKPLERFVNFSADGQTAWVDELLDTQMKLCRGSGVLVREKGKWLIKHYVLSMAVPNEVADEVIDLKKTLEQPLIDKLRTK